MTVSQVQVADIVGYIRLEDGEYVPSQIQAIMDAAKAYMKSYTGLDDAGLDQHPDFVVAYYVLCQDMHDNRAMYIEKGSPNRVIESILGMHCTNLLPTAGDAVG